MATVHLYTHEVESGDLATWGERSARTLQIPRSMNTEDIKAWYRQCIRAFRPKVELPCSYRSFQIEVSYIEFDISDTMKVVVDRKRAML